MTDLVIAAGEWNRQGGFWFPLVPLLFFGLWLAVFALASRRWRHAQGRPGEAALAERYARGEIDADEFHARRAVLRHKD